MSRHMTKPTKWPVRPAKTQFSLGIRPVWSETLLSAWRNIGPLTTYWAPSEDSDQTGRMPRLIWVFAGRTSFCWFCRAAAHIRMMERSVWWLCAMKLLLGLDWVQTPVGFKPPAPWTKVGNSNHLVMLMVCNFQYFLFCCTGMKSTCRFQQLIYTVMSQQRPKESFSWEETISRIDLSDFSLCIVGYSWFWLKVADEESKCIPHEFPRFCAKNATVWCVSDYCLQQCKRVKHNTEDNSITCTIWAASWQNQQNDCATSKASDQPGHPPSLIRVFAVPSMGS